MIVSTLKNIYNARIYKHLYRRGKWNITVELHLVDSEFLLLV